MAKKYYRSTLSNQPTIREIHPHHHRDPIDSTLSNKPIYGGRVWLLFLHAYQPPANTVKVAMNQWKGTQQGSTIKKMWDAEYSMALRGHWNSALQRRSQWIWTHQWWTTWRRWMEVEYCYCITKSCLSSTLIFVCILHRLYFSSISFHYNHIKIMKLYIQWYILEYCTL